MYRLGPVQVLISMKGMIGQTIPVRNKTRHLILI